MSAAARAPEGQRLLLEDEPALASATLGRELGALAKAGADPARAAVDAAIAAPEARIDRLDHGRLAEELDAGGHALLPALLTAEECRTLAGAYDHTPLFRSTVVMARHNFGRGQYRYFDYPLPRALGALRGALYAALSPIANRWRAALGLESAFPESHAEYLSLCHAAGQVRATPLLLAYGPGDYNCLHQDLYGELVFPLQVAILLSEPGRDFSGGEFVLTEQRPRMQSRAEVVPLAQGDAVVFAVNERPVQGTRGAYRVKMRHGVSRVRAGQRRVLGVIFHDAA